MGDVAPGELKGEKRKNEKRRKEKVSMSSPDLMVLHSLVVVLLEKSGRKDKSQAKKAEEVMYLSLSK